MTNILVYDDTSRILDRLAEEEDVSIAEILDEIVNDLLQERL